MKIGIDFDNTIVCYDRIFHRIAMEKSLIPENLPVSKGSVRDYLRAMDQEDIWTELQGYVYGARMVEADPFPGVYEFFAECRARGLSLFIISHRTRYPFLGEQYDLHESAYAWLKEYNFLNGTQGLLTDNEVFFELTKSAKLERIGTTGCDCFIDDQQEFLSEPAFPIGTRKILFDPNEQHIENSLQRVSSWQELQELFR